MDSLSPEEAARVLNAKEVGPGKWVALCPCHRDHSPSLSIMRGDRQALILKCWACGAPFVELLRAIGARRAGVVAR
jgi:DNA primase